MAAITWKNMAAGPSDAASELIRSGTKTASDALTGFAGTVGDYVEEDSQQNTDILKNFIAKQDLDTVGTDATRAELERLTQGMRNNFDQSVYRDGLDKHETALQSDYNADLAFENAKKIEAAKPIISQLRQLKLNGNEDDYSALLNDENTQNILIGAQKLSSEIEWGRTTDKANKDRELQNYKDKHINLYNQVSELISNNKWDEGQKIITDNSEIFDKTGWGADLARDNLNAQETLGKVENQRDLRAKNNFTKAVNANHARRIHELPGQLVAGAAQESEAIDAAFFANPEVIAAGISLDEVTGEITGMPTDSAGQLQVQNWYKEAISKTPASNAFTNSREAYRQSMLEHKGERDNRLSAADIEANLAAYDAEYAKSLAQRDPEAFKKYTDELDFITSKPGVSTNSIWAHHQNPNKLDASTVITAIMDKAEGKEVETPGLIESIFGTGGLSPEFAEFLGQAGDQRTETLTEMRTMLSEGLLLENGQRIPVSPQMLMDMTSGVTNNLFEGWDDKSFSQAVDQWVEDNKVSIETYLKTKDEVDALNARVTEKTSLNPGLARLKSLDRSIRNAKIREGQQNLVNEVADNKPGGGTLTPKPKPKPTPSQIVEGLQNKEYTSGFDPKNPNAEYTGLKRPTTGYSLFGVRDYTPEYKAYQKDREDFNVAVKREKAEKQGKLMQDLINLSR